MARAEVLLLSILLIATISGVALAEICVYEIKVKTGSRVSAGTNSVIGLTIADKSGIYIEIKNLETWGGKMPPGHDYFEKGNLDTFSGREPCLPSPVCFMKLKSDGSGYKPGWYVDYVDVITGKVGTASRREHFRVEQWLAPGASYELSTERNNCPGSKKTLYSII